MSSFHLRNFCVLPLWTRLRANKRRAITITRGDEQIPAGNTTRNVMIRPIPVGPSKFLTEGRNGIRLPAKKALCGGIGHGRGERDAEARQIGVTTGQAIGKSFTCGALMPIGDAKGTGRAKQSSSQRGLGKQPAVGFEPTTSALRKPCSAAELRRREPKDFSTNSCGTNLPIAQETYPTDIS